MRAQIARALGRDREAAVLTAQALARFETWFAAVTSDTYRIAVLDDVEVARLYACAAGIALDVGDAAAVLAAACRPRSLALATLAVEARDLADRPEARAALAAWQRARAEWNGSVDRHRAVWRQGQPEGGRQAAIQRATAQRRLDDAADTLGWVAPGLLARSVAVPPPVSAAEVAAALDEDTAVLDYLLADDELLTCVVTARGVRAMRTPISARQFVAAVNRFHASWSAAQLVDPASVTLVTQTLLGAVRRVLDDHRRIVVAPSGALHRLPFSALIDGGHVVSHVPAAALVPRLAGQPGVRTGRGALVVGDTATDPTRNLCALPGARVEAHAVARLWGTDALIGAEATGMRVRSGLGSGVLHLAAHGVLDHDAPDLSAVMLADTDALTVAELHGIDVDTDLAVLSACDSGRGDITRGGDVVGLTRGLITAGVRQSVVALWPVADREGCLIMTAFTERVATGTPVADALAAAIAQVRGLTAADRRERYDELARRADVDGHGDDRRDVVAAAPPTNLPPNHPTWWAPFIHVGI